MQETQADGEKYVKEWDLLTLAHIQHGQMKIVLFVSGVDVQKEIVSVVWFHFDVMGHVGHIKRSV